MKDSGNVRKDLAEAILKHDSLFLLIMELEDTQAGQRIVKQYFQKRGIVDPESQGLLPLIQLKVSTLLMFPYVSYVHKLPDSKLHNQDLPADWKATLSKGIKSSSLAGTAMIVAIIRHSIAHFLEGGPKPLVDNETAREDQGVDFDNLRFQAHIGSVTFDSPVDYELFFFWLRMIARRHASAEVQAVSASSDC
jgi:hypothetical protein